MDALVLNFPTFYHSTIKNNTSLPQFNAVSVLLLGDVREKCTEESIDDPSVSGYVSGKKPIRKSILASLLNASHEEIVRRLRMLGIQDIQRMVDSLTMLINEVPNLSNAVKDPLLTLAGTAGAEFDFVADVFMTAIKCPPRFTRRLSNEMIQHLNSLGWTQFTSGPDNSGISEAVQETVLDSNDKSRAEIQEESVQIPVSFLQRAKEVTVSYLSLSIPEDKEAAISHFLGLQSNARTLLDLDEADVESIISETEGFQYSMVELKGTWQSINVEFSKWKKLSNCVGCILELEVPPDMGLDSLDEIASSIQNLIHEDANFIFGAISVPEFVTDQIHICAILKIQDVMPENDSKEESADTYFSKFFDGNIFGDLFQDFDTKKSKDFHSGKSHSRTRKVPEKDLFDDEDDDILHIFDRKL